MTNKSPGLIDLLQQAVKSNPAKPAFIQGEQVISYQQFDRLLRAAMRSLKAQGIGYGDVVGLSLDQSPLHCVTMLALAGLGALSVPLHPLLSASLRAAIVARYDVRFLISHKPEFRVSGPQFIHMESLTAPADAAGWDVSDAMPDAATPFRIGLSSGTSGDPKGVLFTHGYLLNRIESTLHACDANSRVIPFDLNFALGFVYAIGALTIGGTVVFPRRSGAPGLAAAINLHAVSHISISPSMAIKLSALLQEPGIAFPSLRHLRLVGSTPQESLIRAMLSRASPNVCVPYGLTEIGPVSMATPEILAISPASAGKILPGVTVEIVSACGEQLASNIPGEIRIKADGMPTGYYLDETQTRLKFRDGWFYPGDRGRISAEGLLFIEGRVDDILDLDGQMVNPGYIEETLCAHPAVAEAAVFPHKNRMGLRVLVAAVIPRASPPEQHELAQYASEQLGTFAPGQFIFVQDFPRTPSGKLDRESLAARITETLH